MFMHCKIYYEDITLASLAPWIERASAGGPKDPGLILSIAGSFLAWVLVGVCVGGNQWMCLT